MNPNYQGIPEGVTWASTPVDEADRLIEGMDEYDFEYRQVVALDRPLAEPTCVVIARSRLGSREWERYGTDGNWYHEPERRDKFGIPGIDADRQLDEPPGTPIIG